MNPKNVSHPKEKKHLSNNRIIFKNVKWEIYMYVSLLPG